MDSNLLVGVAGGLIAVILILREVRQFFDRRNLESKDGKVSPLEAKVDRLCTQQEDVKRACDAVNKVNLIEMQNQMRQMYEWHNKTDEDGVPVWYVRRSLEEAIAGLNQSLGKLSEVLTKMLSAQERMEERILDKIDKMTK